MSASEQPRVRKSHIFPVGSPLTDWDEGLSCLLASLPPSPQLRGAHLSPSPPLSVSSAR